MAGDLPEKILESVDETRRSFLTKLILGTTFVAPSVASFSMSGLAVGQVRPFCSNLTFLCRRPKADCSLIATNVSNMNFSGCDYSGGNFRGFTLISNCFEGTMFAGANLAFSDLSDNVLIGANFAGANLNRANLVCSDLTGAMLPGANLNKADLTGANLRGANLKGANLSGAILNNVNWDDTTCPDGSNSDSNSRTCVFNLKPV